jgi:hypothetical protein
LGTYGIVRNGFLAWFSFDLLADLVVFRRDDEEFGIETLDVIWKREDRHDGDDLCLDLRVCSEGS